MIVVASLSLLLGVVVAVTVLVVLQEAMIRRLERRS